MDRASTTPMPAVESRPGIGSVLLFQRSRAAIAEEILREARRWLPGAELWLLDRSSMRLERPALGGLQPPAEITLPRDEPLDAWPDTLRVPTEALAGLGPTPALARTLRTADDVHGLLVAACPSRRPPAALQRMLAALGAQASAALANHAALEAATERAQQLSALYETAHQISSELDLDRTLATICARARGLTGAEIAYIMLIDPVRGDAYIRVTDGARTEAFGSVRLELGHGLGGLVAEEGRPYCSVSEIP